MRSDGDSRQLLQQLAGRHSQESARPSQHSFLFYLCPHTSPLFSNRLALRLLSFEVIMNQNCLSSSIKRKRKGRRQLYNSSLKMITHLTTVFFESLRSEKNCLIRGALITPSGIVWPWFHFTLLYCGVSRWPVLYFNKWNPGSPAAPSARLHTPQIRPFQ